MCLSSEHVVATMGTYCSSHRSAHAGLLLRKNLLRLSLIPQKEAILAGSEGSRRRMDARLRSEVMTEGC